MSKIHVLLVYGGQSSEHDISLMSARNVYAAIDDAKYQVTPCLIDKQGHWWLQEGISDHHTGHPQLLPVFGQKKFITLPDHKIIQPDVIYPVLHGKWGEDGTIQGFAEMMNLPCVGPSILGAAVTMEKGMTKRLLSDAGVPVVPWVVWNTSLDAPEYENVSAKLGKSLFVKPSRAGSSVGVTNVKSASEWDDALKTAAREDSIVLIEKAIDARELQVAVLGNETFELTDICGIDYGAEFHDFEDKYSSSSDAKFTIPANITSEETELIKKLTRDAYRATGCRGMARVDFFQDKQTNDFYLNEVNTIPGFTNLSIYPRLWQHAGLKYPQLVDRLIRLALE